MKYFRHHLLLAGVSAAVALFLGCTHALPAKSPVKEVADYALRAEQAEEQARLFADQAQSEIERAEMLVAEARAQLERLEQAQRRCAELARKNTRPKPRRVVLKPKEELKKDEQAKPVSSGPLDPQYSASDAPIVK
ncbi:MAG TPA: hypothetical protein PLP17_05585 [Oligoflexia bacterium]|nr:hypothetical protein [Oligoflexia bacterium]